MLIESFAHFQCTFLLKTLVYFFMEGRYPTEPSVKMVHTLTSYISNYKFQFKFNLKTEN